MGKCIEPEHHPPGLKKRAGSKGTRLGMRGLVAAALLETGASLRCVRKLTGISVNSALALKRQNLYPRPQLEALKRNLQDLFALKAYEALTSITPKKLNESRAAELAKVAGVCFDRAGIADVSLRDAYNVVIQKYIVPAQQADVRGRGLLTAGDAPACIDRSQPNSDAGVNERDLAKTT